MQRLPHRPPEVRREQVDHDWLAYVRYDMPAMWTSSDVVLIEYSSPVPCFRCRVQGTEVLGLLYRASTQVTGGVQAVFCSDDCLLDAVHDTRLASS